VTADDRKDVAGLTRWYEQTHGTGITQALDQRLVYRETTQFQEIEVHDHAAFGRVLVLDGTVQLSQTDEFVYHEMAVHVGLLGRRRDRARVLVVGGGDGGIVREVLRHPFVERVVMVEIDERVVEVSNRFLGIEGDYADSRATLLYDDGLKYMKEAARAGERFELIVIDATDSTAPSKFLWTDSFYGDVAACLADDGVAVDSDIIVQGRDGVRLSREPCELSIVDIMRSGRFFGRVEAYQARVPLYPGGFIFFLCSKDGWSYREPHAEFLGRYYNPRVHRGAFALPTWAHVASRGKVGSAG
jgi:spermidine synthase